MRKHKGNLLLHLSKYSMFCLYFPFDKFKSACRYFTRSEWTVGMSILRADSASSLLARLSALDSQLRKYEIP